MAAITKSTGKEIGVSLFSQVKYEHLIAGLSGGVTSTLILHPLDVIKIRFAVNTGRVASAPKYTGIIDAFLTIRRDEGLRGLYRGVTPNVIGAGASWGLYFFFYNTLKNRSQDGDSDKKLSATEHLKSATEAGLVTLLITNPIWVVKTRLCLQYGSKTHYKSMADCFKRIYRHDGFKGYYKGLIPGIFGVSHGAVQFVAYEEMKKFHSHWYEQPLSKKLGVLEYLAFSGTSKLIAVAATYPYQVVRARLQNQHYSYEGAVDCVKQTWTFEGWRGFYKGMCANLVRVLPAAMITFVTYENVSHFLLSYSSVDVDQT